MTGESPLSEYRKKRDFRKTPEPCGREEHESLPSPLFVIQEHDASSLHYDLRLETGGVLASWAVPKGPSTVKGKKRLAVRTENHPLQYAAFEGVIPEGEYGGGRMIVWDRGTYRSMEGEEENRQVPESALEDGHIRVWLEGSKLRGGYSLSRMGKGKKWLLTKLDDDAADARRNPVKTEPESVLSGKTVEQIGTGNRKGH